MTDEDLARHFGPYGEMEFAEVYNIKGYGFVNFVSARDAMAAMEALNGSLLLGQPIRIEFAKGVGDSNKFCPSSFLSHLIMEYPSGFFRLREMPII